MCCWCFLPSSSSPCTVVYTHPYSTQSWQPRACNINPFQCSMSSSPYLVSLSSSCTIISQQQLGGYSPWTTKREQMDMYLLGQTKPMHWDHSSNLYASHPVASTMLSEIGLCSIYLYRLYNNYMYNKSFLKVHFWKICMYIACAYITSTQNVDHTNSTYYQTCATRREWNKGFTLLPREKN